MASNIERMSENDTNNVASNINAKSLVEDVAEKKKFALGDIKNKIDPNSNQNQNKSDKNGGKFENLIDQSSTSGTNNIIDFNDRISGMPIDYETVWSNEWINPVYENLHKWIEIIGKAKMEPEQKEIEPIIDNGDVLEIMEPPKPECGIEELEPPIITDSDESFSDPKPQI